MWRLLLIFFSLSCFSIDKPLYVETKDEVEYEVQENIQWIPTRDTVLRVRKTYFTIPSGYSIWVKDSIKYIKRTYEVYFYDEDSCKEYIYKTILPKEYQGNYINPVVPDYWYESFKPQEIVDTTYIMHKRPGLIVNDSSNGCNGSAHSRRVPRGETLSNGMFYIYNY